MLLGIFLALLYTLFTLLKNILEMRNFLLCLLVIVGAGLLAPAYAQKPNQGKKHPHFLKFETKLNRGQTQTMLRETFGLKNKDLMDLKRSFTDELGFTHEVYQQYYNGVVVEGANITVHSKGNKIWSISGNYRDIYEEVSTQASISESAALNKALQQVAARSYIWDDGGEAPNGELVIVADPDGRSAPRLAYKFDIYATNPVSRADVYIDAHSNQFITENQMIHTSDTPGSGVSLYNGTVNFTADFTGSIYRLRQTSDGNGVRTFDMNNGTSYNNASDITSGNANFGTSHPIGVQAHWSAEQTHKYFSQTHSRNSFDGNGAVINSYVSANLIGMGYPNNINAFWDGQKMTYGDGDGVNYGPLVSLDIVGHEITHGLTQYAANLVYSYESGALNESFSDIFGESIEHFATGSNDWQMGTDIGVGGSGAIRSMDNPNAFGDPDTYGGTNWYTGSGDNGGVHINSGVQNKWFYILAAGESGTNDIGNSYSVAGIGIDKAAKIAYRNLNVYLSTNSQYSDARTGAIQAAEDLYGAGSAEVIATTNAWYAVGVGGAYGTISYCSSSGGNATYEWISSVSLGSFTNNSGAAGYTDFTAQTINVDEGQSYNVSLTPAFGSTVYNEYWKIWIDYNADGDFSDAGELAFDAGGLSNTTVNGSITIPNGLSGTTTRMRVSMKWNAAQTECESFSYGEVEDYTIDIGGGTPPPTCDTPTGLAISNIGTTTADVSWNAVSGAVDYTVRWKPTSSSTWQEGVLGGTSGNFTGLTEGTAYEVQVRTNCASASSSYSASVSFTTNTTPPLTCDTPTGLAISNIGTTTADVSWNGVSGAVDYTIRWKLASSSTWQEGSVAGTAANFTGLSEGLAYDVQVRTNCASASSNYSASVSFTTNTTPPPTCDTPTGLAISNIGTTTADVSWNGVSGAVDYTVRWKLASSSTWQEGSVAGTAASFTGLSEGTAYDVQVRTNCASGASAYSSSVNFTTDTSSPGGCGTLVDANDFESGWGIWNDGGSDARRSANDAAYANGTYCVRLRDNTSTSVMSTDNLDLSGFTSLQVDFSYYARSMDNSNEDFWLQVSTNGGSSYTTVEEWNTNDEFVNGQRYNESVSVSGPFTATTRLRFRADASGNSDWVYIDDVAIYGCTGTTAAAASSTILAKTMEIINKTPIRTEIHKDLVPGLEMNVYPNPVQQELNIAYQLRTTTAAELMIMDLNGRLVQRMKLDHLNLRETVQVDVSQLSSGFYFVHLVSDNQRISKKFIKQE